VISQQATEFISYIAHTVLYLTHSSTTLFLMWWLFVVADACGWWAACVATYRESHTLARWIQSVRRQCGHWGQGVDTSPHSSSPRHTNITS